MNIVHQIIVAALLFSGFAFYIFAKQALGDALISWYLVRVLRLPGFNCFSKLGDMPLGIALICRLLAAGLCFYSAWCFAKLLIILVPLTWHVMVAA
ncbi:hypothetical protein [Novosphingobium resinovorum]|uniref:hypothetical protein n=1 Tax=Novosphingobium resinovorum TaxID=158500 RepID=UPI002ED46C62|nr:hypothetical protein [Novosphingobium resinovorum]